LISRVPPLFQSTSRTNKGGFADPVFDELIEAARPWLGEFGKSSASFPDLVAERTA
jgi:hypothetical protein